MYLDDSTFLAQFNNRSLDPEHFDHRAHLRMAWLHLNRHPFEEAASLVCDGIRDLATKFGAPEKYNKTLTKALMHIINHRMNIQKEGGGFDQFLQNNEDLVIDTKRILAHHYSDELLNSSLARTTWVEPDLVPIRP